MRVREEFDAIDPGQIQARRDQRHVATLVPQLLQDGQCVIGISRGADLVVGPEASSQRVLDAKTGRVVTVEDHSVHGGLGSAVAELLGELLPTPLKRIGVTTFGESGDMKGLYAKHGLDADGISRTVLKFLNR